MKERMSRGIFALDADGLMLDYNSVFPAVHLKAFGKPCELVQPGAYHAMTAYGLSLEPGTAEHEQFFAHFDEEAWSSMPLLEGVQEACMLLTEAGYELVCVTSMPTKYRDARQANFERHRLPISRVVATGRYLGDNPKRTEIEALAPVAFADDLAHNFIGIGPGVHKALIDYGNFDSPNRTMDLSVADTIHGSLLEFVHWWLKHRHK